MRESNKMSNCHIFRKSVNKNKCIEKYFVRGSVRFVQTSWREMKEHT